MNENAIAINERVMARVNALIKKAHSSGRNEKAIIVRSDSSLHRVIKTKAQATAFMQLLKLS